MAVVTVVNHVELHRHSRVRINLDGKPIDDTRELITDCSCGAQIVTPIPTWENCPHDDNVRAHQRNPFRLSRVAI